MLEPFLAGGENGFGVILAHQTRLKDGTYQKQYVKSWSTTKPGATTIFDYVLHYSSKTVATKFFFEPVDKVKGQYRIITLDPRRGKGYLARQV